MALLCFILIQIQISNSKKKNKKKKKEEKKRRKKKERIQTTDAILNDKTCPGLGLYTGL